MSETEWKEIPGYSNYHINVCTLSVKNISTNRELMIRKGLVQLCNGAESLTINVPRLLFCAIKGINPRLVPSDILIINEAGHLVAYDRKKYMSDKTTCRYANVNKSPVESYTNARIFLDKVLISMNTKDYALLIEELYSHRKKLIGHIIKNGVMRNEDDAKELISVVIEKTITNIIAGTVVFSPYQYMYGAAKGIAAEIHRAEKATREFVKSNSNYRSYDKARSI